MPKDLSQSPGNFKLRRQRAALLAAALVVVVTSIPQVSLIAKQGAAWQGSYALLDFDELTYSAYLNALIEGRPRRNNPYLGKQSDLAGIGESHFSIQFLPAYAVALPARALGISASTTFILLAPLMAFASALAIFWLLFEITKSETTSAVGVLIVLLCGPLVESPLSALQSYPSFAFLRRYVPAIPFPLFFLFLGFVWRAFINKSQKWALGAGAVLVVLIYSYFYLWTAASAWLLCATILWLVGRREDRGGVIKRILVIAGVSVCALAPYFYLLSQRATTVDENQALTFSRAPDLFRVTEVISFIIIFILILQAIRHRIAWRSPEVLFTGACAVTPFIVFNQQIISGISLQSSHYEQFIINYLVLVSIVVTYHLVWSHLKIRPIAWATFAVCIGLVTAVKDTRHNSALNVRRDQTKPVFEQLNNFEGDGLALFNNSLLAASALTDSSMPELWAPNMYFYGGLNEGEPAERFYQYLYLLGVQPPEFEQNLHDSLQVQAAVFGLHRVNGTMSQKFIPVSSDEIRAQVEAYSAYVRGFSQQHANRWPLAYVITIDDATYDFTNLDRWYTRATGEKVGGSVIYPVQLNPQP
jgi:hypothetical protein